MVKVTIVVVVLVVYLFGSGYRCNSEKMQDSSNDLSLQTSGTPSQQVVGAKDEKGNTDSREALQGEMQKNPGNKNGMPLDEGEKKSMKENTPKEVKAKDGDTSKTMPRMNGSEEGCGASNSCMNNKDHIIACLRVPGNDSPTLSLLVQNRGASSTNISISAPRFVKLEKSKVSLLPGKDEKVIFSVEDGVGNNSISLFTEDWKCNLSFWDMIPESVKKNVPSPDPAYMYSLISAMMFYAPLALIVILGACYAVMRLRKQHSREGALDYQRLDVALPVSTGGVKETDVAEGWDNSWGENWDDEEAPLTPLTPALNLSSKGLASRRSNKEGWKD